MVKLKRLLTYILTLSLFSLVSTASIYGVGAIDQPTPFNGDTVIPQGQTYGVAYFTLQNNDASEDLVLQSVQITNATTDSAGAFGAGITRVSIYTDTDSNLQFNTSDRLLGSKTLTAGASSIQTVELTDVTLTPTGSLVLMVVYTVDEDATPDKDFLMRITNVSATKTDLSTPVTIELGSQPTITGTISGFSYITVESIAPQIVLPGDENTGMLEIKFLLLGEAIDPDTFTLTLQNDSRNFVSGNSTNGITKVTLYDATDVAEEVGFLNTIFNAEATDLIVDSITEFDSRSEIRLSLQDLDSSLQTNIEYRLYVAYDFGSTFSISENTTVEAEVSSVSGNGVISDLEISGDGFLGDEEQASSLVGGLTYTSARSIIPSLFSNGDDIDIDLIFGENSTIPMLSLRLRSYYVSSNIRQMRISNPGSIYYNTSNANNFGNIQRIKIFEDSDHNAEFDGVSSDDTLIAELELGTGSNEKDLATVATTIDSEDDAVNIKPYDDDNSLTYPSNNEKIYFIIYEIGTSFTAGEDASGNTTSEAIARVNNITASGILDDVVTTINLSGRLPAGYAVAEIQPSNFSLLTATDISPTYAIPGQFNVPMFYLKVDSESAISSASFSIYNANASFTSLDNGVNKINIYKDNGNGIFSISSDTFLNSDSSLTSKLGTISGIPLSSGVNHLIVTYDLGPDWENTIEGTLYQSQFLLADSESDIVISGQVPFPNDPVSVEAAIEERILVDDLEVEDTSGDSLSTILETTGTFNISFTVENIYSESVIILADNTKPKIYLTSISGSDISGEFTIVPRSTGEITIAAGNTRTFDFDIQHTSPSSEGTIVVDAYVTYYVSKTDGYRAKLSRYEEASGWSSAVPTTVRLTAASDIDVYDWSLPSYISSMQTEEGATKRTFSNQNYLPKNSALYIYLANNGSSIDPSSLSVRLNGTSLSKQIVTGLSSSSLFAKAQSTSFQFDTDEGILYIDNVGSTSGTIVISAKDIDGNNLDSASISFFIDSSLVLSDLLLYPNPYQITDTLQVGFNTSQRASAKLYIVNYLGQIVYEDTILELTDSYAGYHLISLGSEASWMSSGHYFAYLLVEDADGVKESATTKFAIY